MRSAIVGAVFVGAVVVAGAAFTVASKPAPVDAAPRAAPTRAEALARITSMRAVVRRADRAEAKLTSWGEFRALQAGSAIQGASIEPARPIWIVAVSGLVTPGKATPANPGGKTYPWAVFAIDAVTGEPLYTNMGPDQSWPAYFDRITDRAP